MRNKAVRSKALVFNVAVAMITAAVVAAMMAPGGVGAGPGDSDYLRRFSANFTGFDPGDEVIVATEPSDVPTPGSGGTVIYDKSFFSAADINVVYVTISAVGDVHDQDQMALSCLLDDVACNPGGGPLGASGAPAGWVVVMRHTEGGFDGGGGAGDLHDNVVAYTWCTTIGGPAGNHNVKLKMGAIEDSGTAGPGDPVTRGPVFLEAVHVFVDGSRIKGENACTEYADPTNP